MRAEPGEDEPGLYAFVYPNDNSKIYLEPEFGHTPVAGYDSTAGTLAHEISHFNDVGGTMIMFMAKSAQSDWKIRVLIRLLIMLVIISISLKVIVGGNEVFMHIDIEYNSVTGLLDVSYHNVGDSPYYLDKNFAFINGKYRADCLVVTSGESVIERVRKFKLVASDYPDGYVKIGPNESFRTSLDLSEHFLIPDGRIVSVKYDGLNFNPVSNELEHLESRTISVDLRNHDL